MVKTHVCHTLPEYIGSYRIWQLVEPMQLPLNWLLSKGEIETMLRNRRHRNR